MMWVLITSPVAFKPGHGTGHCPFINAWVITLPLFVTDSLVMKC